MVGSMKRFAYFRRRLSHPIEPKGGPGALLETLEDCAKFMGHMHRWRQAGPHWDRAAELILKAAKTGCRADVDASGEQFERALRCDGWL
jgi:hypothetical protein